MASANQSARRHSSPAASVLSLDTIVDDDFTETCCWSHCQVATTGATAEVALFHMRSHQRSTATASYTGSHFGCAPDLQHPSTNPSYLMEEYCGIALGREVERMLSVRAEDVWLCPSHTSIDMLVAN